MGPKTARFETEFAKYLGTDFVVGTCHATAAIHLALVIHGIKPGDLVMVPAINFVSGAAMIRQMGAIPVWVDVKEDTLCADPEDIARKMSPFIKAVMVVHYAGMPCDMDAIAAATDGVSIIEDAAHACGAMYANKRVGSLGRTTVFSFHAVKNLSMGEGGAIAVSNKQDYEHLLALRWLGINKSTYVRSESGSYSWNYAISELGWKYHLSDIAAAIGLVQLAKLDAANGRRKELSDRYRKNFHGVNQISLLGTTPNGVSSNHLFVIRVDPKIRDQLIARLADRGIGTSVHYTPTYRHPAYWTHTPCCPVTEKVVDSILSLPLHLHLTEEDIDQISEITIRELTCLTSI